MKIRAVKKALKALRDGRKTPLLKRVKLQHIAYFANNEDKKVMAGLDINIRKDALLDYNQHD